MNNGYKIALIAAILSLNACAGYSVYNDPYGHTKVGAAVGAASGAVIGHQMDDDTGRYYGGAAGALIGGAVGNMMDRQRQTNQRVLDQERRRNDAYLENRNNNPYPSYPSYPGY